MSLTEQAFQPLQNSTAPSFNSSALGAVSVSYALQSTGVREFQWPSNRAVRLLGSTAARYYVNFGTSDIVAASTNSMWMHGDRPGVFSVSPRQTHVAFYSSTDIAVNVTLGVGR